MMKQLTDLFTAHVVTLLDLSTKTNSGDGGGSRNNNNNKARSILHVCAYCKREVYHKDAKCLDQDSNKAKRYPGWKSIFVKE